MESASTAPSDPGFERVKANLHASLRPIVLDESRKRNKRWMDHFLSSRTAGAQSVFDRTRRIVYRANWVNDSSVSSVAVSMRIIILIIRLYRLFYTLRAIHASSAVRSSKAEPCKFAVSGESGRSRAIHTTENVA